MTSPDSNAYKNTSKYQIEIGEGKGIVIGDNTQVVQNFYGSIAEPQVDLTAAEAIYRQKVVDMYKLLNFSGFDSPDLSLENVPLEEVFVRLSLTIEKVMREPVPSEKTSQRERNKSRLRERVITVQEPVELDRALENHLLIIGEPGAGKSTLLRWLAVIFARGNQREPNRVGPYADADRLPVLVELGRLPERDRYLKPEGGETPNWSRLLPEYLNAQGIFTDTPPQMLTQALADGRCLLLFDGLDEVADRQARARLARSLAELASLSPGNRVIIGSRSAGVSESEGALRSHFRRCQIERFTPVDVQRFFRFWYALDHDLTPLQQRDAADELYARLQETPAILQLATTPLLSTILILIWRKEGDLPRRRVELYERCCRVLIERWEASHDVAYQGIFARLGWERHLRLLAPLAYVIHSREMQTSAGRKELLPVLTKSLQAEGLCSDSTSATLEAEQFLMTLALRSGFLQYLGGDQYGFPHQTFQEYLTARYIAAQPEPEYIDLVMIHLHEAWWREVHLLTIAHLGSRIGEVSKASTLILSILHAYAPPSWVLRSSRNRWLRLVGPGKFLPQVQLDRRIAWIHAREFELAAKGYAECIPDEMRSMVGIVLSAQAASLVRHIIYDEDRRKAQENLLAVACQLLQRQSKEAVVDVLLAALHDTDTELREAAAKNLGQVGVGNEAVVSTMLEALHDANGSVRGQAAGILGQVGVGNEAVVNALLDALHDTDAELRAEAAESLGQVGVGNEAVVSALLDALHDTDRVVRWRTAKGLGQVGVGNEAVVSALLQGLHDTDGEFQRLTAKSLGQVGVGNEAMVSALLDALHDTDRVVREAAAEILGQVGVGNEAVAKALSAVLHDPESKLFVAIESLGQIGVGNEVVVSALLEALHDRDEDVRLRAAESLGRLEIKDTIQLRQVLSALNHCLHSWVSRLGPHSVRQVALKSIQLLLDGRPIPSKQ